MRHLWRSLGALTIAFLVFALPAAAVPDQGKAKDERKAEKKGSHYLRSPMQKRQDAIHKKGIQLKLKGKAKGKVAQVAIGQYALLQRTGTDKIFVVIAEFGNTRHPAFPDSGGDGSAITYEGPLHNSIPQPDRSVDNSTLWQSDYNRAHYENMYFNRMAAYYQAQSSGRYTVDGRVTEWVKVPFNEARYGRNVCGGIVCNNTWFLVRDAVSFWVQGQLDAGQTLAQVTANLKSFDVQDRYDADADGNFDEPDGFIDHFQIVHAGGDEAAGDDQQGSDAIWSHRWYAALAGGGPNGFPGFNAGSGGLSGGTTVIPNNPTGVWVGDYTIQPENGGLGVFAHEFGHDLALPDLYDTSGNTGGAENSTGFWTLMSSGANIGDGGPDGIGDAPTNLGAWEKFQLGWLGCEECPGGTQYLAVESGANEKKFNAKLSVAGSSAGKDPQALFVVLPEKKKETFVVAPKTGSFAYWSGAGDNLSNRMTKSFTLPAGATLTADVWYDTEEHFDYAFLEASTDGGTTWTPIKTSLSKPASDDQGSFNSSGTGIGGSSGGVYLTLVSDPLPAGNVTLRFRYETDGNTGGNGVVIDNIAITGQPVDGAETDTGWTFEGFSRLENGQAVSFHFNAYIGEYRGYVGYDTSLRTAYNFGFLDSRPNWVEHYPYQDGLLITYWDESFSDNNVGEHPGGGWVLPVDAHPTFYHSYDGHLLRPRILSYDSTFGTDRTDSITVHKNSQPTTIPSQPAQRVFDDRQTWWYDADEHAATGAHVGRYQPGWYGVDVPKTGTIIKVKEQSRQKMHIEVSSAK